MARICSDAELVRMTRTELIAAVKAAQRENVSLARRLTAAVDVVQRAEKALWKIITDDA